MRKAIFNLHLYAALATSIVLIVTVLSGALLVFEPRMDRWLDPKVSYNGPRGEKVSFAAMLANVQAAFPDKRVLFFYLGEHPDDSIVAHLNGKELRVYVDSFTGKILGSRYGYAPANAVRELHKDLLAGKVGNWIVWITTFVALFLSLSGLYLWWPVKRIKVNPKVSWRRINYDLHLSTGFFSSLIVAILCITGFMMAFKDGMQPFVNQLTASSPIQRKMLSKLPADAAPTRPITADEAVKIAQAQLPGSSLVRIGVPINPTASYDISFRYAGDEAPSGRSWVTIDQYSGEVLARQDSRTAPAATQIDLYTRAIHTGYVLGWPTRVLVALSCLAVVLQAITGFMMWRNRSRKKRPARARPAGREVAA